MNSLAAEPTGNLDTQASEEAVATFPRLNAEWGITMPLVTHEPDVAAHTRRIVHIRDGLVSSDKLRDEGEARRHGDTGSGALPWR